MKTTLATLLMLIGALGAAAADSGNSSCITCHALLEEPKLVNPAKLFDSDIHHQAGLTCADCHGGDPNDESMSAMSRTKGFRGVPKKARIPDFCARCHSDIAYMHRFNPKMRADQLSQYLTSVHGKRLKQGDTKVAACVDCHGIHNILAVSDTRAPVYPANVASTCAHCHADAAYMKDYQIPTDQVAQYQKSVHAQMLAQGDVSAPTCTTCHGNHGATPPGVSSVANVCGTCHVVFAQLFEKSPHQAAFARMGLPGCVQCHSNHEIVKPSDEWVGVGANSVCSTCHASGDPGYRSAQAMAQDLARLNLAIVRADTNLDTAERKGMEVSSAKVELTNAHEARVKARVNVHTFRDEEVRKITDQGLEIATRSDQAGVAAIEELNFRRKGLGISLITILVAIAGLYLKIRQIESRQKG
ncbi:MAG: cytochrome c3 family protein [Acidobacteriia bacterium]|nr:cytochrome c3 family protein [Terriglobia bacterium]